MNGEGAATSDGIGSVASDAGAQARQTSRPGEDRSDRKISKKRIEESVCSIRLSCGRRMTRKPNRRYQRIAVKQRQKLSLFARQLCSKNFACQTLQFCNDFNAGVDHRGFIKVDEVDGRSPVERAAATFVPDLRRHCAG